METNKKCCENCAYFWPENFPTTTGYCDLIEEYVSYNTDCEDYLSKED